MQGERGRRAEEIALDLQRCIERAGLKVEVVHGEQEITVAARENEGEEGISVVAQVALQRAKAYGIGSIDHEVRKVRAAQISVRPSLGVQAASSAPTEEPEVP